MWVLYVKVRGKSHVVNERRAIERHPRVLVHGFHSDDSPRRVRDKDILRHVIQEKEKSGVGVCNGEKIKMAL